MRCLKVHRREPVGKERVEIPKGNNGIRLEKGTKGRYSHPEHWRKNFEELRKPLRFKEGPNSGI